MDSPVRSPVTTIIDKVINIRITEKYLDRLVARADDKRVSPQELAASILHKEALSYQTAKFSPVLVITSVPSRTW